MVHGLCLALQGSAAASSSSGHFTRLKEGGRSIPHPFPRPRKNRPQQKQAKAKAEGKAPMPHKQDNCQNRRDLQRAESKIKAEIVRLEGEVYKRDLQAQCGAMMLQLSQSHKAKLETKRGEVRGCEDKVMESNKRLNLLQATTATVALQQHKA